MGTPLADYLDLDAVGQADVVLDLALTPNLARCYSIIGVAREVAALTGQPLHVPEPAMEARGRPSASRSTWRSTIPISATATPRR